MALRREKKKHMKDKVQRGEWETQWEKEGEGEVVAGKREDNNANWHFRNEMPVALATGPRLGGYRERGEDGWGCERGWEGAAKGGDRDSEQIMFD